MVCSHHLDRFFKQLDSSHTLLVMGAGAVLVNQLIIYQTEFLVQILLAPVWLSIILKI
ncbi:hypothetical protein PCC7424_4443 [Gloeothece citriformis PCC 7424]|uniref:Uncharacterized protein n=1 Tax=Gloeothece citriformis (strain PCC 7424) TaxID=65393 RepID=B7K938_GLOC7|nr:hypothetical protein PCC7424_4443 [Gloeothece citriformis PCC 7424]